MVGIFVLPLVHKRLPIMSHPNKAILKIYRVNRVVVWYELHSNGVLRKNKNDGGVIFGTVSKF